MGDTWVGLTSSPSWCGVWSSRPSVCLARISSNVRPSCSVYGLGYGNTQG